MSDDKKRPTVNVNCAVPMGLRIHLTQIHEGFMGQKTPVPLGASVELRAGGNPGIDKEFFDAWLAENKHLSLVLTGQVTATDENPDEPERV